MHDKGEKFIIYQTLIIVISLITLTIKSQPFL